MNLASHTDDRAAFSINGFCHAHSVSRTTLYELWREGKGPQFVLLGSKRLIPREAAFDWLRSLPKPQEHAA